MMAGLAAWPLLDLFVQCALLSLMAIGGALATAPELHRHVVDTRHWLTDADFGTAVALAQASPGPNLLFIAVVGFKVAGLLGALAALFGMLLPSTVLTLLVFRWGNARRDHPAVMAFVTGMAPVTLGLVAATAWLLARPLAIQATGALLVLASLWAAWRTRWHPLWLIAAGALVGALGWV